MNKKLYIIFTLLIIFLTIGFVAVPFQNDTFSAIKIGDYILNNGIDFVEHFNIMDGLFYHNARWLFNVIIALVYNNFGNDGVYIFTLLTSIALALTIYNVLIKLKNNVIISFLFTVLAIYCSSGFLTGRAQVLSYIFFILEVFFIERLISSSKKRYIIYIVIVSILTANIHTTVWPVTLILFLPYIAEYILSKKNFIKNSKRIYTEVKDIKILLVTFILVLLSGLFTPLGSTPYTYMFKTLSGISTTFISELTSANIFYTFPLLAYTFFIIFFLVYLKKKLRLSDIFMILGLYIMSIMSYRNAPFLYFISPICLGRIIKDAISGHENILELITKKVSSSKIIIAIIVLLTSLIFMEGYVVKHKDGYINNKEYPVEATDYILENIDVDNMRIFNGFNFGSYLEFRGIKVFLDSRSEVYCKEYNDVTILEDWLAVRKGEVNYKEVFDKYKFTHALLNKGEIVNKYIKDDRDYNVIYEDEYFILYEKIR